MLKQRGLVRGVIGAAVAAMTIVGAVTFAQPAQARADEGAAPFHVDPVHSMVVFRIGHLGVSYVYGRFNAPSGSYNIDLANPSASMIDVALAAEKVDTGNERRDNHLRSPDFFNAKQFPTITFKSDSFEKNGDKSLKVRGKLTLLGVTKDVEADLQFIGEAQTQQGYKSGFEATFTIKRSEFGMTTYTPGLGDEVKLLINVEAFKD